MDPVKNPYSPGAGTPPPELAGREELRELVRIALERTRQGRWAKSLLMVGLRGMGKTVLLDRMREDAEGTGLSTLRIEAPEQRSLPAMLAPQLMYPDLVDDAEFRKILAAPAEGYKTPVKLSQLDLKLFKKESD